MTGLFHYEAPRGKDLDGLVDAVNLPLAIRAIARPNSKSIHSLAADVLRSLGATRDLYSKAQGSNTLLNAASAWSLARGITDVYFGEVQDMDLNGIHESLDFAQRIGANLHLISGYGETAVHAPTIEQLGGRNRRFTDLPVELRAPAPAAAPSDEDGRDEIEIPDDDWISYRPTYRALWPTEVVATADRVYLDSYRTARHSGASTAEDIARLIAGLWQRHGSSPLPATTTVRAVQAGLFRNGLNVRVSLGHLERFLHLRLVNPLTAAHYQALSSYADPWRAAAAVLHAHHISTEDSLAIRALDVQPDGTIPSLTTAIDSGARPILAAQRWLRLIAADENPPLIDKDLNAARAGIRRVTRELALPITTNWAALRNDRWQHNYGVKVAPVQ
ncbi:hypothetical protein [Trujillonella endophytica]|uniref:Uncharacterized protein n=1 Tax=Trujillonella endophytica TaxID=673521 RepID=A0A1H8VI40_9ACTN|nr:hypothetical protein [Trujillella endophytica]SEP14960.1 hypothetical protein SAMN05660991_03549 [Trujillella endophytica]